MMHRRQIPAPVVVGIGDVVVTSAGIVGTITALDDDLAHLEVDTDVVIRITIASIATVRERHVPATPTPAPPSIDTWLEQIRSR